MLRILLLAVPLLCAGNDETLATALVQKHCLTCHNTTARMGGLVLDSREAALKGGKNGPALIPGNAAASPLVKLVREGKMPAGGPLLGADRDLLARWVNAGAPWSAKLTTNERKRTDLTWWSLQPLRQADPAATIDRYLIAAMAAKGLSPSPPADRRTLIRRVTFDLTGLPPTPEEFDAFLNDNSTTAYEHLVDRLLASPAYGERWGRHWMDVIRFGESHGYEQNHLRPNAWPFRDYVIRSFNEDKPYDRMILEHLAGDRIAPSDPNIEVGTGFLVAGPHDTVNNSNEAAKRQQRADDLDDMINATASAFLGLTVNCAKCHDHKFDPIQQADYYRMAALLNGARFADRELATADDKAKYKAAIAPLDRDIKEVAVHLDVIKKDAAPHLAEQREGIIANHRPAVNALFTEESFPTAEARFIRLRINATSTGGPAGLDEIEVWSGGSNIAVGAKAIATSTRKADDDTEAYSARHLTDGKFDQRWFAADARPVNIEIELPRQQAIQKVSWSRDRMGGFQGRFDGPIPEDYRLDLSLDGRDWKEVASSAGRIPARPDKLEQFLLLAVLNAQDRARYNKLRAQQTALQKRIAAVTKPPTAYIGRFEQPDTPIYLLKRGNVMDRGDIIAPASLTTLSQTLPAFTLDADAPEGERRLALARWIAHPKNPLTPRVMANRLWHYHFGHGIVDTPSDFGYNGGRPTHPELLDYLAERLIHYGWRLKPLHKEILMSAAYQQSSAFEETKARIDNDSRYLWRYPPRRLEAEAIRDAILATTGKLDRHMGGPGFHLFRYTVDNVATYYPLEKFAADTFRRSVYQTAARSVRSEMLGQYDCPDSSLPEPRRIITTTPLQALALLNNTFILDQAGYFAQRLEREAASPAVQVERAFQLAFGRPPEPNESAAALSLIRDHGLAAFCRALLNANEFVYVM
ncbi:MAG: DUF1553 domain-containing protein [Acidobacteria bacterium]|nr:DUF1553 domain-containing protein [Acidobacteriota bacterium]